MKNLLKSLFLLSVITLVFQGCKKDDSDNDPNNNTNTTTPYFGFAKVGNKTNYTSKTTIMTYNINGTMNQTVSNKFSNNVYQLITVMDLGLSSYGFPPTTDTSYWYVSNTEFGSCDDQYGNGKQLFFTKGDAVNKTYTRTTGDGQVITRTVVAINEMVTTPVGSVSTFKIKELTDGANEINFYVNKDMGMIKTTTSRVTQFGTANVELLFASKNF